MNISILPKLNTKKILVGITGGIAAYKTLFLIRYLIKAGAEVKVIITQSGLEFVTRVTLETLSKNNIYSETFAPSNYNSTEHIALTDWADLLIVAPATANIIGKYANGIADDALSTTLLAFSGSVIIAPAMNSKMYANFSVQKNIEYLKSHNVIFADAESGMLACGYNGKGRMMEPEDLYQYCELQLLKNSSLKGINVLITASRTKEAIDPVRYISNNSSGKMGFSLATACVQAGANVTLITGPTALKTPIGIKRFDVVSADEMAKKVLEEFPNNSILIKSAAVADFTPFFSKDKMKKRSTDEISLKLQKTTDVLLEVAKVKTEKQFVVGFSMETKNLLTNSKKKIEKKHLNLLVANTISEKNPAFASDSNSVSILDAQGNLILTATGYKYKIAETIVKIISQKIKK